MWYPESCAYTVLVVLYEKLMLNAFLTSSLVIMWCPGVIAVFSVPLFYTRHQVTQSLWATTTVASHAYSCISLYILVHILISPYITLYIHLLPEQETFWKLLQIQMSTGLSCAVIDGHNNSNKRKNYKEWWLMCIYTEIKQYIDF